jgi:hypothetical protein
MTVAPLDIGLGRNELRRDARATRPCVFTVRCVYIDHANVPDAVGRRPSALLEDTLAPEEGRRRVFFMRFQQADLAQGAGRTSESPPQPNTPHSVEP